MNMESEQGLGSGSEYKKDSSKTDELRASKKNL